MLSIIRLLIFAIGALFLITFSVSCTSSKKLAYFQDLPDKNVVDLPPYEPQERVIANGDDLYIYFSAKDNEAANYFNKTSSTPSITSGLGTVPTTASTSSGYSYIVSNDGYLEIPNLGIVKVAGLTDSQLRAKLLSSVAPYLKNPIVEVRFNTFKISVIGEVRSPGRFTLDMQRTTILDALAAAGDLPVTAKRTNIELYRDYNGTRRIYKIDLTKAGILNDETLFQLRHNDVLYVKPFRNVFFRENFNTVTATFSVVASLVTLAVALLR